MNSETKTCQNCNSQFIIDQDDFTFYEKVHVPPPTFCPQCRKQRRLAWRNEMILYSRTCDLCKKSIVSLYSTDKPFPVYCQKCWWSDRWDPRQYAQAYDPARNFFEQFKELQDRVPALAMVNDDGIASTNSQYTHDFAFGKNCYMVFVAWKVEDCLYGHYLIDGKEIVDSINSMGNCERLYDTVQTDRCYECRNVYYSLALSNCAFCYDCRDSSDCFMCVGVRHKRYCFKDQQYSKEEYEKILKEYRLDTASGVARAWKEFEPMLLLYPRRFSVLRNCVNCTGDCGTCPDNCGDGVCGPTELCYTCPADCGACPTWCGDGICEGAETCGDCPSDCGFCPGCGDWVCDPGEDCWNCPGDCDYCEDTCGNGHCGWTENCVTCSTDCGPCSDVCGDGRCGSTESCWRCEEDCGACPDVCGDGTCGPRETCADCTPDCGPCP